MLLVYISADIQVQKHDGYGCCVKNLSVKWFKSAWFNETVFFFKHPNVVLNVLKVLVTTALTVDL